MKVLLMSILVLGLSHASIKIYSPPDLKALIGNDGEIQSSIANFGHIPYGHSIIGQAVHVADNAYGCNSFASTLHGFHDSAPIVLVKRGECSFVQKVRNIEHGGGKLAIVVDEMNDENAKFITMVDDGTGNGIVIPSVMINKEPGEKMIDFVEKASESVLDTVKIMASFSIRHSDDHVEYDLILSTTSDRTLDFITDFREFHDKLDNRAVMTPHYVSFPCYTCNDDIIASDCFGNGKYCELDFADLNMDGRTILLGAIRQKCIYKIAKETKNSDADWWDYMAKAHTLCYDDFTEDCSKMVHTRLGLNYTATQECVDSSFTNKGTEDEDNTILGSDYLFWEESGYAYVPSIFINEVKYQGDFVPEYIFEAVCAGFATKPSQCDLELNLSIDVPTSVSKTHVKFNWFLYIIIAIIVFNVILVAICIKRNKNTLTQHVKDAMSNQNYSNFDRNNRL